MPRTELPAIPLLLIALLALSFPSQPAAATAAAPCEDGFFMQDVGPVCPRAAGLFEVFSASGRSLGLTHGPDPVAPDGDGPQVATAPAGREPHCVDGKPRTYYIHVLYARAHDDADRYASLANTVRDQVRSANAWFHASALATGADMPDLRVLCDSQSEIQVSNAVLATDKADATFSTILDDLAALGYDDSRVKYWVFYDDPNACSCSGTATLYADDDPSERNLNNGNGQALYAVNFAQTGDWGVVTMLHELSHTLGAVQNSAPHATGGYHCTDGLDVMCYNDGGPNGDAYTTSACDERAYDCGNDDYCHGDPEAGTYLAEHWNLCAPVNRYVHYRTEPLLTTLECPSVAYLNATVACDLLAEAATPGVAYVVDWGDGNTTRVPEEGYAPAGELVAANHTYTRTGEWMVRAHPEDEDGRLGNVLETPLNASLDDAPPAVQILHPRAGWTYLGCSVKATGPWASGGRPVFVHEGCLEVDAADDGAGLAHLTVRFDGREIATHDGPAQGPLRFKIPLDRTAFDLPLVVEVVDGVGNTRSVTVHVDSVRVR